MCNTVEVQPANNQKNGACRVEANPKPCQGCITWSRKLTDYIRLRTESRVILACSGLGPEQRDGASVLHYRTDLSSAWVDSSLLIRN
jgi:hypothetical protein